jgi:hypothetical protein
LAGNLLRGEFWGQVAGHSVAASRDVLTMLLGEAIGPAGAEARFEVGWFMYGLKPVPFTGIEFFRSL